MMKNLSPEEQRQFHDQMVLPLFANRRDKGHDYLQRFDKESFTIITDVCDNFSKSKLKTYFKKPVLSFLFVWFSQHKEGKEFALEKFRSYNKRVKGYSAEMIKGIKLYGDQALKSLQNDNK